MKKLLIALLVLIAIMVGITVIGQSQKKNGQAVIKNESLIYTHDSGVSFEYPKTWKITEKEGNKVCPEEDTYRTQDQVIIYDSEIVFEEVKLANSQSFIRSGVRFYKMNPKVSNGCNDVLLRNLAQEKITGEEISSVRLVPVEINGMKGVENENASRLNTEARPQYTLFKKNADGTVLVIQTYANFIPYFGSPELNEMETKFAGEMNRYIKEGNTAAPIREYFSQIKKLTRTIK